MMRDNRCSLSVLLQIEAAKARLERRQASASPARDLAPKTFISGKDVSDLAKKFAASKHRITLLRVVDCSGAAEFLLLSRNTIGLAYAALYQSVYRERESVQLAFRHGCTLTSHSVAPPRSSS